MDRSELFALDTYKNEEMKIRLKPITDWNRVPLEEEIWNCDSNEEFTEKYNINCINEVDGFEIKVK
jgi:hypothetical protein|uniref:Uncharacterized protein n=1 Tax=Siphoviridae sp. cteLh2 TaxID=2825590 RepID=A0A8S5U5R1_9CAUD|nr:hypothetical protein [uncultured Lachnoclostridium sp.]DAF89787.1 MAG TPA: hypothetical protein [Siphoviridae sp. cteLh2]